MKKFLEVLSSVRMIVKEKIKEIKNSRLRKKYQPNSPILGYKILEAEGFSWASLSSRNLKEMEKAYRQLTDLCAKHELNIVIYN